MMMERKPHKFFKREDLNPNWVSSIKGRSLVEPRRLKASSASKSCSIHRVPSWLSKQNRHAYDPQLISIGPFHYRKRKRQLQTMEEHKWRYLRDIISRKPEGWLEDCLATVKGLEDRARNYYSEVITLDSDSFAEMMVLDGCFMIELFRKFWLDDDDIIIRLEWPRKAMFFDLILMENQIPFFILQRLSGLIDASSSSPTLVESALYFLFEDHSTVIDRINDSNIRIRHLLHLLHSGYVLFPNDGFTEPSDIPRIPGATRLEEVGIRFRKRDVSVNDFLDIKFHKGVIEIPNIEIWDKKKIEFLNLIAFEQCYPHCKRYITAYTFFMDCLNNTAKDVEILCQKGIINNDLGNKKLVASLFNNMTREAIIYYPEFYLSDVCGKINRYSERTLPKLRASLVHDYFNTPWAIVSFLAALLLLLLTATQTFFSSFPKFADGN
eukprot:TRINITY_DN6414_c0_g2_i1.p1 TRINITY_DN6414_c0_g2~~TRINITY_DN6414_c0_g2_i1.p1  ORF type:complete len:438 (-),score=60.52 TRINITY_DN6414_c0_g2_i1:186-1499(-)